MTKQALKDHKVGDYTYGEPRVYGQGSLEIGKFCSIAGGVTIILGCEHNLQWTTTYPFSALFKEAQHIQGHPFSKGPVKIGHDVWIGQFATIMSGVTIGNGAVIGARAVVTRDVAPFSVVAGNPTRHIKFRLPEEWCGYINSKLKWWDWPIDIILKYIDDILQPPGKHLYEIRRQVAKLIVEEAQNGTME